jgi:hypothetical protein
LIRGARHVIFYSLPEYALFYSELVNMLSAQTGENKGASGMCNTNVYMRGSCSWCWFHRHDLTLSTMNICTIISIPNLSFFSNADITEDGVAISCLVLYTAYERMALERIVGAKRCAQMISGAKATFMFC